MDGELFNWLYHRLLDDPNARRTPRCTFGDGLIALIGLYAALNNRSVRWAACVGNWPIWCRRVRRPSYSRLVRRLATPSVATLLRTVDAELVRRLGRRGDVIADGKPLVVGGFSRDPDATRGHVPGGFAVGYRLHVLRDAATGVIAAATVTGLADGEATVLRPLVRNSDLSGRAVRADANYDSNRLYACVAGRGGRLIAPRKKPRTGLGHGRHHPDRLRAIRELESCPLARRRHTRLRGDVERAFADLGNVVGLWSLPPFVRRLRRVRRWVRAKLLLYHLALVLKQVAA